MADKLPTKRESVDEELSNPTRREALAKLGMISATALIAAEIVTLSSNPAHAGASKSKPYSKSHSRSRSRRKGPSEIDETYCNSPDTDTTTALYDFFCTG